MWMGDIIVNKVVKPGEFLKTVKKELLI